MKYTSVELKAKLLKAIEDSAYYSAKWGSEGGKDAREDMGYYNGRADLMRDLFGELVTQKEINIAYQAGEDKYDDEAN